MKRIVSILMMMVAMMTITAGAFAQTPNQKQRISREQLAEKQAQHIAHDLAFDEKTTARFIETYTACQKEIWALGPRIRRNQKGSEAQSEQNIKRRFEMSEKMDSNIRYRIRMCIWKHWKTPQNRAKKLMKLGIEKNTAYKTAYAGQRIAYVCNKGAVNVVISNKRLASFGLISMLDYYTERCVIC